MNKPSSIKSIVIFALLQVFVALPVAAACAAGKACPADCHCSHMSSAEHPGLMHCHPVIAPTAAPTPQSIGGFGDGIVTTAAGEGALFHFVPAFGAAAWHPSPCFSIRSSCRYLLFASFLI